MGTRRIQQPGGALQVCGNFYWPPEPGSSGPQFPFASEPDNPNPWDLQPSELASPDLAASGWPIFDLVAKTPITRAGDVDINTNPAAGTYRSTIVGGELWIQLPPNSYAYTLKAGAASGETYRARIRPANFGGGSGNEPIMSLVVATGQNLETPGVDYFRAGLTDIHWQFYWFTGTTFHATVPNVDADPNFLGADTVYYINVPAFSGTQPPPTAAAIASLTGFIGTRLPAGSNVALGGPVTHVGLVFGQAGSRLNLHYVDYIRRQPLNQFP